MNDSANTSVYNFTVLTAFYWDQSALPIYLHAFTHGYYRHSLWCPGKIREVLLFRNNVKSFIYLGKIRKVSGKERFNLISQICGEASAERCTSGKDLQQEKLTWHLAGRHCHGKWSNNKKWQTSVPWCSTVWLVHCLTGCCYLGRILGVLVISMRASGTISECTLPRQAWTTAVHRRFQSSDFFWEFINTWHVKRPDNHAWLTAECEYLIMWLYYAFVLIILENPIGL